MHNLSTDIDWLLTQWGIWSRMDGTGKLTDTASAMFVGVVPDSSTDECMSITDEQAMQVDYVLSALNGFDHINWVVIVMDYYYNMTDSGIVKQFKKRGQTIGRHRIQARKEAGRAFLAGFISN